MSAPHLHQFEGQAWCGVIVFKVVRAFGTKTEKPLKPWVHVNIISINSEDVCSNCRSEYAASRLRNEPTTHKETDNG